MTRLARKSASLVFNSGFVISFFAFVLIYHLMYGRFFLSGDVLQKGGVLDGWSMAYLVLQALNAHTQVTWWDFSGLSGPLVSAASYRDWLHVLSPLNLPFIGTFFVATRVWSLSPTTVAKAAILYQTLYPFALCLLGLMLATWELVTDRIVRLFPPLVFTLASFQFQELQTGRSATTLVAAIFLLYGLLRFYRRRDPMSAWLLLAFFANLLVSGSLREIIASAHWVLWLGLALVPAGIVADLRRHAADAWYAREHRFVLLAASGMVLAACAIWVLTGDRGMADLAGRNSLPADVTAWKEATRSISSPQNLPYLVYLLPFADVYWKLGAPASLGVLPTFQYIGLATLPLGLVALCLRWQSRIIQGLLFAVFASIVTVLVMATVAHRLVFPAFPTTYEAVLAIPQVPRGGPALLLLLMAAVGLDLLKEGRHRFASAVVRSWRNREVSLQLLGLLGGLVVLTVLGTACLGLVVNPLLGPIRHSLMHVGLHLTLFCLLTTLLLLASNGGRRTLTIALLVLTLADVTISASSYFLVDPRFFEYRADRNATPAVLDALADPASPAAAAAARYRVPVHVEAYNPTAGELGWGFFYGAVLAFAVASLIATRKSLATRRALPDAVRERAIALDSVASISYVRAAHASLMVLAAIFVLIAVIRMQAALRHIPERADFGTRPCPIALGPALLPPAGDPSKTQDWRLYAYNGASFSALRIEVTPSSHVPPEVAGRSCELHVLSAPTSPSPGSDWRIGYTVANSGALRGQRVAYEVRMSSTVPMNLTSGQVYLNDGVNMLSTSIGTVGLEWRTYVVTMDISPTSTTLEAWVRLVQDDGSVPPKDASIFFTARLDAAAGPR